MAICKSKINALPPPIYFAKLKGVNHFVHPKISKKMPNYNQNLADELKERYLLAASTIRNWKHRQHIPDRYIAGYVTRQRAPETATQLIKQWIQLSFIKHKGIEGVRPSVFNDMLRRNDGRKHARLRTEEAESVIKQLNTLVKLLHQVAQTPDATNIQTLLHLPFIHLKPLINNPKLYAKLIANKQTPPNDQQLIEIQTQIAELIPKLPVIPML